MVSYTIVKLQIHLNFYQATIYWAGLRKVVVNHVQGKNRGTSHWEIP